MIEVSDRTILVIVAVMVILAGAAVALQFMDTGSTSGAGEEAVIKKTDDGYYLNLQAALELAEMDPRNGTVNYRGFNFTGPQRLYIFSRAVVMIGFNDTGMIHVRDYGGPEDPYGYLDTATLTESEYLDMAERTYTWMESHGRSPNHVGIYVEGSPDITPELAEKIFRDVLLEYMRTGMLPEIISV